jgi:hypothetical protein
VIAAEGVPETNEGMFYPRADTGNAGSTSHPIKTLYIKLYEDPSNILHIDI